MASVMTGRIAITICTLATKALVLNSLDEFGMWHLKVGGHKGDAILSTGRPVYGASAAICGVVAT